MIRTVLLLSVLAVAQGSAGTPSSSPGQPQYNFLYDLLVVAGYNKTCVTNIIKFCDPTQEGNLLLQEMRELKNQQHAMKEAILKELQDMKETVAIMSRQAAIIATTPPLECEDSWSEYQWSCYKAFKTQVTYEQATANCRAHGAHLATIGSEGENSFVASLIENASHIGLSDVDQEGVYTWQDGSPFSYSKWASSEPDGDENYDCVYMYRDSTWSDFECEQYLQYVCEKRLQ